VIAICEKVANLQYHVIILGETRGGGGGGGNLVRSWVLFLLYVLKNEFWRIDVGINKMVSLVNKIKLHFSLVF